MGGVNKVNSRNSKYGMNMIDLLFHGLLMLKIAVRQEYATHGGKLVGNGYLNKRSVGFQVRTSPVRSLVGLGK